MDAGRKTEDWIREHESELIGFLQTLIRIPSVTGEEAEIQHFISDYVKSLGAEVDTFDTDPNLIQNHPAYIKTSQSYKGRPNVVATFKGTGGGKSLLLNGHVDVVPENADGGWRFPPRSAVIENGRLYGRGASDMKSGIAAMTMAMKAVAECGLKLKGDVIFEYVVDEETTGNAALDCALRGYKADAGICCATSDMCIAPGCIGRYWFTIHVKGKAPIGIQKHYEGISAIELGYIVKHAIDEFEKFRKETVRHPYYEDINSTIPCTVLKISSGLSSSYPEECELKGSMALVSDEDPNTIKKSFEHFIKSYCQEQSPWLKEHPVEIFWEGYNGEPSQVSADSPIVLSASTAYEEIMGEKPKIKGRRGPADNSYMTLYADTPSIVFGPGITDEIHIVNESVLIKDYIDSIRILARMIINWCGIF